MKAYELHTHERLWELLAAEFPVGTFEFMNGFYCAATRGWIAGAFAKYFFEYLAARGDLKWRRRGNQCEHFALRAALEAVHLFSQTDDPRIPSEAESLAVAACKYQSATLGCWHEVNLWFVDGVWLPWEPQRQAFFEFTEAERQSVRSVIIP